MKNKVAPRFRECEFDILFGEGISREGDVLDLAVTHNIVDKSGARYSYEGERIGQARENARAYLKSNHATFAMLDAALRQKLNIGGSTPSSSPNRHQCHLRRMKRRER